MLSIQEIKPLIYILLYSTGLNNYIEKKVNHKNLESEMD